ncbi:MAG: GntR family transcriptional regulator, partial [Desulfobacterota bacterium]|nr:GntR family transcriptional regulator [Thermodesulfobacteriota bacterium]
MGNLPYQPQSLVEIAYKALKKDITERVLAPGQKIIIREINERYGISETPIKQALNRLIAEGLVESIPRRGVRV